LVLFTFFIIFSLESYLGDYLFRAFNSSSLKQTRQTYTTMMVWHLTIPRYRSFWLIDSTMTLVPPQKGQLMQSWVVKFWQFILTTLNQQLIIHHHDSLTLDHTMVWIFLIDWHHNGLSAAPKRSTQAVLSCQILTVHLDNFEPAVRILSVRIKEQYLAPVKKKYLSSTPYK